MTFSHRILVGLAAGVVVGLFLGDRVGPLAVVADGFVKLLQMTVLPYVMVSIMTSLGRIDLAEAKSLGLRAGAVVISLWAIALFFAFLFPLVFPAAETASFFSTSLLEKPPPFDFIGLYIPSNPFFSLANNIVPAVVLFSVILGVALIGLERKAVLLDVLDLVGSTISRATRFIVQLTPYGIFALAATAAGTMHLEQLERIQIYLITYVAISLLVSLWVLPGLVAAVTPIPYRQGPGPDARCGHHRLHRRRSLHRPAQPDRVVQRAAGAISLAPTIDRKGCRMSWCPHRSISRTPGSCSL